jgi:hypothetical protein
MRPQQASCAILLAIVSLGAGLAHAQAQTARAWQSRAEPSLNSTVALRPHGIVRLRASFFHTQIWRTSSGSILRRRVRTYAGGLLGS